MRLAEARLVLILGYYCLPCVRAVEVHAGDRIQDFGGSVNVDADQELLDAIDANDEAKSTHLTALLPSMDCV